MATAAPRVDAKKVDALLKIWDTCALHVMSSGAKMVRAGGRECAAPAWTDVCGGVCFCEQPMVQQAALAKSLKEINGDLRRRLKERLQAESALGEPAGATSAKAAAVGSFF
jgi:hypothetical protein